MLSRLAFRSVLRQDASANSMLVLVSRSQSTQQSAIQKQIAQWNKANDVYFGPERDTKNFPHPVMAEKSPPVRLGFIPDAWFQAFYNKTGVSGPYVLGAGVILTALSKEYWVIEHQFIDFISFWGAIMYISYKFGPKMGAALDKTVKAHVEKKYVEPIEAAREEAKASIAVAENAIWSAQGQTHLFDAKKENVGLQLEAEYRQRLHHIHQSVKKRLDYQLDVQTTKRSFEQTHMVNWIVDNVVKNITPQQEKESINRCISDLKALSASA